MPGTKPTHNKKTNMSKNKEATTALSVPGSEHTLEERRVINEDVLKVTGHELKREFTRRVEDATAHRKKCYEALGDFMHAYNEAAEQCWMNILPNTQSDLKHSFSVLNQLAQEGDEEYDVSVKVNDQTILFGLQGMERDGYYHQGETALSKMREAFHKEEDSLAADLKVPVSIEIKRGDYTEMRIDRVIDVTCSKDLNDARRALVEASEPFYEAITLLAKAKNDLDELPRNMEELDMQATARRIRDMGGEEALRDVLASATSILGGDTVKGLAAALPDYRTAEDDKAKDE